MSGPNPYLDNNVVQNLAHVGNAFSSHLQAALPAWTATAWVLLIVLILLAIYLAVVIYQRIFVASKLKRAALHARKELHQLGEEYLE